MCAGSTAAAIVQSAAIDAVVCLAGTALLGEQQQQPQAAAQAVCSAGAAEAELT
jgi:hypothetical protein